MTSPIPFDPYLTDDVAWFISPRKGWIRLSNMDVHVKGLDEENLACIVHQAEAIHLGLTDA